MVNIFTNEQSRSAVFGVNYNEIKKTHIPTASSLLIFSNEDNKPKVSFGWMASDGVRITDTYDEIHDTIETATESLMSK